MADAPRLAFGVDEMVELTEAWLARHQPGQVADPRGYARKAWMPCQSSLPT